MANNLTQIRGKHEISQTKLAKAVGVTKQGMCYAEKNKCSVSLAKKVSKYLDEDILDVLGADVLAVKPKTEEEKRKIIEIIKNYEVK